MKFRFEVFDNKSSLRQHEVVLIMRATFLFKNLKDRSKAKIYSRMVMTPMNAKLFYRALAENLQKFEGKYGEIHIPESIILDPNKGFIK